MKVKTSPFRLVCHVGCAKTGTSSIQKSLNNIQSEIKTLGFWYLGLTLEYSPVLLYDWQTTDLKHAAFIEMEQAEITNQLSNVLKESITIIQSHNCHTAIWSNESFFHQPEMITPVLQNLISIGINVQIIVYVRNHESWIMSAYYQWGIKHKIYSGDILPFSEYFKKYPVNFRQYLELWFKFFPKNISVFNFDAVTDVVKDFFARIKLEINIDSVRVNEKLSLEELLFRALFNRQSEEPILPSVFDKLFPVDRIDLNLMPEYWISNLLEINQKETGSMYMEDLDFVNNVLKSQHQPILEKSSIQPKSVELNHSKMIGILLQTVIHQAREIEKISKYVNYSDSEEQFANSIDEYRDGYFMGWVLDKYNPLNKVIIALHCTNGFIGTGVADQFRQDLLDAKIGNGSCAFKIKVDSEFEDFGDEITIHLIDYNKKFYIKTSSIKWVS